MFDWTALIVNRVPQLYFKKPHEVRWMALEKNFTVAVLLNLIQGPFVVGWDQDQSSAVLAGIGGGLQLLGADEHALAVVIVDKDAIITAGHHEIPIDHQRLVL